MTSRTVPTPATVAAAAASHCGAPVPGGHCTAPAPVPDTDTAAAVPVRAAYDRHAWEAAVLASGMHRNTRIIAFVLAHLAGDAGYLPAGGAHSVGRLTHLARITPKQVRLALQQLTNWHYLERPDTRDWPAVHEVRPVSLTVPPRPAPEQADDPGELAS